MMFNKCITRDACANDNKYIRRILWYILLLLLLSLFLLFRRYKATPVQIDSPGTPQSFEAESIHKPMSL